MCHSVKWALEDLPKMSTLARNNTDVVLAQTFDALVKTQNNRS